MPCKIILANGNDYTIVDRSAIEFVQSLYNQVGIVNDKYIVISEKIYIHTSQISEVFDIEE